MCVGKMVNGRILTIFLAVLTSYISYNRLQGVKEVMTTLTTLTIFR